MIQKWSICNFPNYMRQSNDKDRVTIHCKRRVDLECLWSVHARVENSSKAFVIKQFDDVHTCGSSFRTIKHTRMTSSMIGGLILSEVCNKALTSVSEVVCDFKDYYGTEVSYRQAWMDVEKTRDVVFCDYSSSFDDLRWYVDTTNDCNPKSVFDMEFDIDSKGRHFKCLFFAFEACIHGFKYCQPVLMLDETFLKGRHKGCLLAAMEKDSNQEKKLEEAFNDTKASIVKKCSDDIHEIQLDHSVMVDIGKPSCSCRLLEINSFPCKHGFYAIKRSENDLNCFLNDYYHVRSYCDSYSHSIYLVPSMWKPNVILDDDVVLPPLCKKPVGRPRIERIPLKGGSRELGAVGVERWELIIERHS
ncbi:hypothetical protein ACSBR2_014790 [Camellia fascicularis]